MIPEIGHFALALALSLAVVQSVLPILGASHGNVRRMQSARSSAIRQVFFVGVALAALMRSFVVSDFTVRNVAENSHSLKPLLFKIAGTWGSHEGSLLLWVLILTVFGAGVAVLGSNIPAATKARTLSVRAWISVGFLSFLLFTSNPFDRVSPPPADGSDLNPLLQDVGLAMHPPLLYFGGSMAEVVREGTRFLSPQDRDAMAIYLFDAEVGGGRGHREGRRGVRRAEDPDRLRKRRGHWPRSERNELMRPTRRDALKLAGLAGLGAGLPRGLFAAEDIPELSAQVARLQLLPDSYPQTEVWGYGGTIPGREIRVGQGQRLRRRFVNDLPQASSIHWHGIRIDNAMDGVSGLTQDAVAPGGTFDYDFVTPDAGTYWYHAHNRSWEQVARGLHGPLIVDEAEAPDVDREEVLVLDDWLLNPETGQIDDSFDHPMMMSHSGRTGNYVTTNGRYNLTLPVRRHERLRLRLINASNARIFQLKLSGLEGWIVALDGMPLASPAPVEDVLVLGPAQRTDLIVDVLAEEGETADLVDVGENFSQVVFTVSGTASQTRRAVPVALPPNPKMDLPDLAGATPLRLVMSGGAMGRMDSAILKGERMGFRELAAAGRFWAFNGVAEMTDTPLADLGLGEPVRLVIVNDTVFPHAMHLHGMHFREVSEDGALGPLRDTILVGGRETREITFTVDNPGDWLFHCHMLGHAASGMTTWVRVA